MSQSLKQGPLDIMQYYICLKNAVLSATLFCSLYIFLNRYKDTSTALSLIPGTWDKDVASETDDFQLCTVAKTTSEFRDVSRRFLADLPSASIVSVKRVQNVELWEEFSR